METRLGEFRHRRYRLLGLLGEGGMGRVHLAEDLLESGERVALKLYPPWTAPDLLRREFLALRALRHPGIARAHHFGASETDGAPFFTMEHIAGEPLDRFLAGGRRGVEGREGKAGIPAELLASALDLFSQAASATGHLHRRGLLHLDLKPANMLVVEGGSPPSGSDRPLHRTSAAAGPLLVLIDFGLLRPSGAEPGPGPRRGTLPFMAPELFDGGRADSRADVYALGVTFYLALTGRYPLQAGSVEGWALAHRKTAPEPALEAPPVLQRFLGKMLAKEPARRFRDGEDVLQALLALRSGPDRRAGRPPPIDPELAGRERELALIERWRDGGRAERPLLFITGPEGIGKSRLLEAAETSLEMAGLETLRARRSRDEEAALLLDLVRRAFLLYPRRMGFHRAGRGARLLASLAGLSPRDRSAGGLLRALPPGEGFRIARQVALERLAGLLREEPVFLLVDDLEEAESRELELLLELATALTPSGGRPPAKGGIVAAWKTGGRAEETLRALASRREPPAAWIPLGPLAPRESRRLLESGSSAGGVNRAIRWRELHRKGRGNPFLLLEELRALGEEGDLKRPPLEHRQRLRRRIQEEEPRSRLLVSLLALSGRPAPLDVLARAAGGTLSSIKQAARRMSFAGLLAPVAGGRAQLRSARVREAALALIPSRSRPALHRSLAAALLPGARSLPDRSRNAEAAYHLFQAGERDQPLRLAESLASGEEPQLGESRRVIEVLGLAARLLGTGSPRGRAILEALSERLERAARFQEALRVRGRLASLSGGSALERARRFRKLAGVLHRTGNPRKAERLFGRALQLLSRRPGPEGRPEARERREERLGTLAELALLHHFREETALARRFAEEGLRLVRGSRGRAGRSGSIQRGSIQRAIDLHAVSGQIAIRALDFETAARTLLAGLRLARAAGPDGYQGLLLNNLGLARHLQCRFTEALAVFRRAERSARELSDSAALATIRSNVAQIQAKRGRFRSALEELARLEAEPVVLQSPRLALGFRYSRALVEGLLGDPRADWEGVRDLAAALGDRFLCRFASLYLGEREIARASWSTARAALSSLREGTEARMASARLARLEAALGRPEAARSALARPGRPGEEIPELAEAWNRLYRGQALLDLDGLSAARAELVQAYRFFHARGVAPGTVEASLALADLELRRAGALEGKPLPALTASRRWVERARAVFLEEPEGRSPRFRSLRTLLLEARLEIRGALSLRDSPPEERLARARDLLLSAGGDGRLPESPGLALEWEALDFALTAILGGKGDLDDQPAGLRAARAKLARLQNAADRRSVARVDFLSRIGLPEISPLALEPRWPRGAGEGLARALRVLAGAPADGRNLEKAAEAALRVLAETLGARAALALATPPGKEPELAASWPEPSHPEVEAARSLFTALFSRPAGGPALTGGLGLIPRSVRIRGRALLLSPIRSQGRSEGILLVLEPDDRRSRPTGLPVARGFADGLAAARLLPRLRGSAPSGGDAAPPPARAAMEPPTESLLIRTRAIRIEERPEAVGLSGKSPAARKLFGLVAAAASTDLPVLITGESGSGKEVVARAIHRLSGRSQGPFLSQSCAAIPAGLLEADLFGYERGSFTGADKTKSGFLGKAEGGTFLLDEIGDAEPAAQAKILRVIEERKVRRVGGSQAVDIDVRFMAVTQRDLDLMARSGEFRRDLFYRLSGIRIHVPPLRERLEDLAGLLTEFLRQILGHQVRIAPRARARLWAHGWPGNVRELQTVARRLALALDGGGWVRASEVDAALAPEGGTRPSGLLPQGLLASHPYPELKRALEIENLRGLWTRHGGDLSAMAADQGTTVRSIYRSFQRLGLKPKAFRQNLSGSGDLG